MDLWQHKRNFLPLINQGESETVEFKKSTASLREGIEAICAFANHLGGYLFFGIEDDGSIIGHRINDDTLKNIANSVKLNTNPKLYPLVERVVLEGKECVAVTVEESPLKPHLAYGRAFLRVGTTNQKLDRERYEHLLQQRFNGYGFDYRIQPEATLDDIDMELIYEFLEISNSIRNLNESLLLPPDVILKKLDLMKGDGLTNGAILLFGKNPVGLFSNHFEVKCGRFLKDSGYDVISNEKEFNRNILRNFHSVLAFVLESIEKSFNKAGIYREERWEFPVEVIRETLVNMFVHRDYRQDIKSTVEIRPSSISFNNPAQLFGPAITLDSLKKYHPSRPGNKLIAKIFYLMGLFENWGGGTLKIVEAASEYGKPVPEFCFEDEIFRVLLFR